MHRALEATQGADCHPSIAWLGRHSVVLTADEWETIADRLQLSPRELQIAQGFLEYLDEGGVAQRIGISAHTVHSHARRMYVKNGVNSRCEFVVLLFAAFLGGNGREGGDDERGLSLAPK